MRVAVFVVAAVMLAGAGPAAAEDATRAPIDWRPVWLDPPRTDPLLLVAPPYAATATPRWRPAAARAPGAAMLPPRAPSVLLERRPDAAQGCAVFDGCLPYVPVVPITENPGRWP
ncbi:MAG TPA: hypothetical protein VI319_15500 [Burkholderiales bacterium]